MKKLHLPLKKKWFDMIASGEKKEEYRELKEYWNVRLKMASYFPEEYVIVFHNGYGASVPRLEVELVRIEIRQGKEEWGAERGVDYFVLVLGSILKKIN